jgi:putative membrane protein
VRGFIVGTIVCAIALYAFAEFVPGYVSYEGGTAGLLAIAAIFGVVNGLIGPIVRALALPLSFLTLGLIGFLVNAGLLLLTAVIANETGFDFTVGDFPPDLFTVDTIVAAVVAAIGLSVISTVIRLVLPD